MSGHPADIYRRGFQAGWERPDSITIPADVAEPLDDPVRLLDIAHSALVQARIHADEPSEWTGMAEVVIDRLSAYLGEAKYARGTR